MFTGRAEKHVREVEKGMAKGYHLNPSSQAISVCLKAFLRNMGKNTHGEQRKISHSALPRGKEKTTADPLHRFFITKAHGVPSEHVAF